MDTNADIFARILSVAQRTRESISIALARKRKLPISSVKHKKIKPNPPTRARWGPPIHELPVNEIMPNIQNHGIQELQEKIRALSNENMLLKRKIQQSERDRRLLNDHLLQVKGRIRIFCRVKPSSNSCVQIPEDRNIVLKRPSGSQIYVFDRVFGPKSTQFQVFQELKPYIQSSIDGQKVCLFSYGQTGSGKTYTITGQSDNPGVLQRAASLIFAYQNIFVSVSCFQLYMDTLSDLLAQSDAPLKLRQSYKQLQINGLSQHEVHNMYQFMKIINQADGNRQRRTTHWNQKSSRSHTVFQITISLGESCGHLCIVDLAGSERSNVEAYSGKSESQLTHMRNCLEEAKFINRSLTSLGRVIRSLSARQRNEQPAYRESKLTRILQESLSTGSIAVILTVAAENLAETSHTLLFGAKAQRVIKQK